MSKKKRNKNYVDGGRVLVQFNTGSRPHRSLKDYTRKRKHKNREQEAI